MEHGRKKQVVTLLVVNPLPLGLGHYVDDLVKCVGTDTISCQVLVGSGIERTDAQSALSRLLALYRLVKNVRRSARLCSPNRVLIAWPMFGYLDLLLWPIVIPGQIGIDVVLHDFISLRRQYGAGQISNWIARKLAPARTRLICHNRGVERILKSMGWERCIYVPLPIANSRTSPRVRNDPLEPRLVVAGHFKTTKNLEMLAEVGRLNGTSSRRASLYCAGHGWPRILGWARNAGVLSDAEFDQQIGASSAILIPYEKYSQSEVMIRAFMLGVPVIGLEHEQLSDLYGGEYPGTVNRLSADLVLATFWNLVESQYRVDMTRVEEKYEEVRRSWVGVLEG